MTVHVSIQTAPNPGAVAIIQLVGDDVVQPISELTGRNDWLDGRFYLVNFAGIDTGLACVLRPGWAQLMPHGGPRVVQKIIDALVGTDTIPDSKANITFNANPNPRDTYPEANSDLEADILATIARAASPAAVDLLLAQTRAWEQWLEQNETERPEPADIIEQAAILDRLIDSPSVVVVGQPNVGKSTLTNRMLGRSASIVADLPGTTRDWVGGMAELTMGSTMGGSSPLTSGIAVRWLDTPGLRGSDDAIEQSAIQLANSVIHDADVLIVLRDSEIDWPNQASLSRSPDLWAVNKVDRETLTGDEPSAGLPAQFASTSDGRNADAPLLISAEMGQGVAALQACVIQLLGLAELPTNLPWAFSPFLRRELLTGDEHAIEAYVRGR